MISKFSGKYAFLRNDYPCNIVSNQILYPSVEHAFQAFKTNDPEIIDKIRTANTAIEAKSIGRSVQLPDNWDSIKLSVMESLLLQKFKAFDLKLRLLMTGNSMLVQGDMYKDTYWGVTRHGDGQNHLGLILMKIRLDFFKVHKNANNYLLEYFTSIGLQDVGETLCSLVDPDLCIFTPSSSLDDEYDDSDEPYLFV